MNTELLKQNAEMLREYFGIQIDMNGNLSTLPVVLDQYTPDMDRVPEFVLCLGNDVGSIIFSLIYIFLGIISQMLILTLLIVKILCQHVYSYRIFVS